MINLKAKEKIINILIKRDNISKNLATDLVNTVIYEVFESLDYNDFDEAEQLFLDELGLESDYLLELLGA